MRAIVLAKQHGRPPRWRFKGGYYITANAARHVPTPLPDSGSRMAVSMARTWGIARSVWERWDHAADPAPCLCHGPGGNQGGPCRSMSSRAVSPVSIWVSHPASSVPSSHSTMLFSDSFESAYMTKIVSLRLVVVYVLTGNNGHFSGPGSLWSNWRTGRQRIVLTWTPPRSVCACRE